VYIAKWTKLADGIARIMETGLSEPEAISQLCQSIADHATPVRVRIAPDSDIGEAILGEGCVAVPPLLSPSDFDWAASRPREQWFTGPSGNRNLADWVWRPRNIDYLEVNTAKLSEFWPKQIHEPDGSPLLQAIPSLPLPERELRRWYKARVRNWPPHQRPPSADQDLMDVRRAHPRHKIARPAIRTVRLELAPSEWTSHGRRKLAQNNHGASLHV
jgi:hypothetical protein